MFDKYLIDMKNPDDALVWRHNKVTLSVMSKFTPAFGPEQKDEIGGIAMRCTAPEKEFTGKSTEIFYHEHLEGCETFFIAEGEWEFISLGRKLTLRPGDLLHVQPFQGHAFRPLSSNSRLIVMFQGMDMRYAKERSDYMQAHFPEIAGTPEFKNQMQLHTHAQPRDNSYYYDIAPEGDSPAHRRFGEGIRSHALPGMTLNLIIARYETHGVKEVWEACMKSGLRMEFATPRYDHRLFWVREGKIKFNIDGTEFAAGPDMLVYVPPFHTFTLETVEDSDMVDLSCPYLLQDLLEELHLTRAKRPEKLGDPEFMAGLLADFRAEPVKYTYDGRPGII